MNKLLKIFMLLILILEINAQSVTVMPYYLPINYKDSGVRKNSFLTGIYGAFEIDLNSSLEMAFDYSNFDYVFDAFPFKIKQYDLTVAYTNKSIPEWLFRLGGHYIVSDDVLTDQSYVLFGGVGKYKFRKWDAMFNVYFSNYSEYNPSFMAIQLSPNFGLNFSFDRTQGIYFNTQLDYIILSKKNISDKKNYFSVKETITYYNNKISVSAYVLLGEQKFAVRQNGFLVYNSADLMKTGFGGSVTYSFTPNFFLKGGVEYDNFDEEAYGTSASSTKFIILAGFNL